METEGSEHAEALQEEAHAMEEAAEPADVAAAEPAELAAAERTEVAAVESAEEAAAAATAEPAEVGEAAEPAGVMAEETTEAAAAEPAEVEEPAAAEPEEVAATESAEVEEPAAAEQAEVAAAEPAEVEEPPAEVAAAETAEVAEPAVAEPAEEADPAKVAEAAEPSAETAQHEAEDLPVDKAEQPSEEVEGPGHDEHAGHSSELHAEYADILMFLRRLWSVHGSDIPAEDHTEFCEAFRLVSEGRGYIEGGDVRQLLQAFAQDSISEVALQHLMAEQGLSHDSRLSLAEMATLVSSVYRPRSELTHDLVSSFRVFDRNGKGYLKYDELYRAMFQIGDQALDDSAKEDFEQLVRLVDKSQDGRIDYSAFCQIVTMSVSELRRRLEDE